MRGERLHAVAERVGKRRPNGTEVLDAAAEAR